MGKTSQQRRADRRRARAASATKPPRADRRMAAGPADSADPPAPERPAGPGERGNTGGGARTRPADRSGQRTKAAAGPDARIEAARLVAAGAVLAFGPDSDDHALEDAVHTLIVRSAPGDSQLPLGEVATDLLLKLLDSAWDRGWQPADLAHIVRRHQATRVATLAAAVIGEQAARERAMERAPSEWMAQLEALAAAGSVDSSRRPLSRDDEPVGVPWTVTRWQLEQGMTPWDGWRDILALIGQLHGLHPLTALGPTPAQWDAHRLSVAARAARSPDQVPHGTAGAGHDPRMLSRIRALLAKAEATTFSQEADAFTSKAQDLMTRYAIDEALLDDATGQLDVPARRIHIDNPYAEAKVQLLSTVGEINRVRVIWDGHHGMATAVGMLVDLELVEMLFTSLLIQATREMTHAGNARTTAPGYQNGRLNRSPSFRRAFLLAYANRIGERLGEAGERAGAEATSSHGADLVPVLARRSAAVDSAFTRLFPQTREMRATRVNARGWDAGRAAADRAVFAAGQVEAAG